MTHPGPTAEVTGDAPDAAPSPPAERDQRRRAVVVGVDGSLEAAEAAQHAALAAGVRGVDLLVVHAFSSPPGAGRPSDRLDLAALTAAQRVVDDALTQIRVPTDVHVHTQVELTKPGALLLRLSHGAALVTIGQHVFDIADQLVGGSVAGPLAAAAGCPVVVVPRGWSRTTRRPRTVAVALHGTDAADEVLAFAFAEAERHQSPVLALHASAWGTPAPAVAADLRNLEEILAAAKQSHPDLAVSVRQVSGEPAQAVLDASRDVRLMVVGRGRRHAHGAGRHPVTQLVLVDARCPLAVVA